MTKQRRQPDDIVLDLPTLEVDVDGEAEMLAPIEEELHLPGSESEASGQDDGVLDPTQEMDMVTEGPSLLGDATLGPATTEIPDEIAFAEGAEAIFVNAEQDLGFGAGDEEPDPLSNESAHELREMDDGGLDGIDDPHGKQIDEHAFPPLDGSDDDDDEDEDEELRDAVSIELPALEDAVLGDNDGSRADENSV
ncbi:MAG: hypothetical protein VB934_20385 [Polyangiaceae bacterium]